MNSRWLKPTGILVLAAALLTGCAQSGGSPNSTSSASGNQVTITYISTTILEDPEKTWEQGVIDAFNAQNNGVQVQVEGVDANDEMTKLTALATSNQMPDFYMTDMKNLSTLAGMGVTEDVSKVFPSDYLSQFDSTEMKWMNIDGTPMGIPWFTTPQGVVYRTDLFAAAGITSNPTTWDQLVADAKLLTTGNQYGMALVGTADASGAGRFSYVLRNFGVNEFTQDSSGKWSTDIGSQNFVNALQTYTDLFTTDGVVPPGVTETSYSTAVNQLSSGQAAMLITGSNAIGAITSQVPALKGKLGSFAIPAGTRSVTSQAGFAFCVSPTGQHQDAVAKFLEFMVNNENSIAFSQQTGRLPTLTTAMNDPQVGQDPALGGFMSSLTQADSVFILPTIANYSQVNDIYGQAYQSVFTGQATVTQAAATAQQAAQQIVDSANNGG